MAGHRYIDAQGNRHVLTLHTAVVATDGGVGTKALVAAVEGARIHVVRSSIMVIGTVTGYLRTGESAALFAGPAPNAITPAVGFPLDFGGAETVEGEALNWEQTAGAGTLAGHLLYVLVPAGID